MKNTILAIFLILLTFSYAQAQEKTVFLDLNYVLSNSIKGKKILKDLDKINKKNLEYLKKKESSFKKEENEIRKKKNIISEEEFTKIVKEFNKKFSNFNQEKKELSDEFLNKRKTKLDEFFKSLDAILKDYMENNSIEIILNKKDIIIANSKNDITKNILDLANKKIK
tara:strand:- start:1046 stop:1549 length:504 start_codon:yes stop_codon:yes gene_type:complete